MFRSPRGETSAKSVQTQKRITACFLDLISQRKWHKISVKEICASAKITRGTFYQYFDDIYDLMEGIQSDLLYRLKESYNSLPKEYTAGYSFDEFLTKFDYSPPVRLCVWLDFAKRNKNLLLPLFDAENGDPAFVQKVNNHRQRRWLEWEAPIRGLKTFLILLCSDHSKLHVLIAFHPAFYINRCSNIHRPSFMFFLRRSHHYMTTAKGGGF